jgi:hypothetical protein
MKIIVLLLTVLAISFSTAARTYSIAAGTYITTTGDTLILSSINTGTSFEDNTNVVAKRQSEHGMHVIISNVIGIVIFLMGLIISQHKLNCGSLTARKWLYGFTIFALIAFILGICFF